MKFNLRLSSDSTQLLWIMKQLDVILELNESTMQKTQPKTNRRNKVKRPRRFAQFEYVVLIEGAIVVMKLNPFHLYMSGEAIKPVHILFQSAQNSSRSVNWITTWAQNHHRIHSMEPFVLYLLRIVFVVVGVLSFRFVSVWSYYFIFDRIPISEMLIAFCFS